MFSHSKKELELLYKRAMEFNKNSIINHVNTAFSNFEKNCSMGIAYDKIYVNLKDYSDDQVKFILDMLKEKGFHTEPTYNQNDAIVGVNIKFCD